MDIEHFFLLLRGPIPALRREWIDAAFASLDRQRKGYVYMDTLIRCFDPTKHPEALRGLQSQRAQIVFRSFLRAFTTTTTTVGTGSVSTQKMDTPISYEDFVNYYHNVSAAVQDDLYFQQLLAGCWSLPAAVDGQQDYLLRQESRRDDYEQREDYMESRGGRERERASSISPRSSKNRFDEKRDRSNSNSSRYTGSRDMGSSIGTMQQQYAEEGSRFGYQLHEHPITNSNSSHGGGLYQQARNSHGYY